MRIDDTDVEKQINYEGAINIEDIKNDNADVVPWGVIYEMTDKELLELSYQKKR